MVHFFERLAIWLTAAVGGVGLMYVAMTAPATTSNVLLGVFLVLGLALLVVGVLGFASEIVVAMHGRLPGGPLAPVLPRTPDAPRPNPAPPTAPPIAPTSTAAKSAERVFVPSSVTPLYLASFFEGHTDAEGKRATADYNGKWMPVSGQVSNVQVFETSAALTLYHERGSTALALTVSLWFDAEWIGRVGLLREDDSIEVVGEIASSGKWDVRLSHCELTTHA